jgi:hypothetical protein
LKEAYYFITNGLEDKITKHVNLNTYTASFKLFRNLNIQTKNENQEEAKEFNTTIGMINPRRSFGRGFLISNFRILYKWNRKKV